jgi:NAD+ synthase (glutamine-hydrolysing)
MGRNLRIALAQLNYRIGDFPANTESVIAAVDEARRLGAEVVVFAELAVCGYPPLDLLDYPHFLDRCTAALAHIASNCTDVDVIIGSPVLNPQPEGKNMFNAAVVLSQGRVQSYVAKTLLPTYDVFDEYRWFEPNRRFECIELRGVRIALTVCEDLWNMDEDPLYTFWPMKELVMQKPDLMINIAASPYAVGHADERKRILQKNAREFKLPLLYVNQIGAHADLVFDGASLAFDSSGEIVHEMRSFEEDLAIFEFDVPQGNVRLTSQSKTDSEPRHVTKSRPAEAEMRDALVLGIRDFFRKSGFSKAVLGLSGGIDSAVVLALAAEALGASNVHAVLMPSPYSSDHSVSDSLAMVQQLACSHELIPIGDCMSAFDKSLVTSFAGTGVGVAEENIQARIRATLLMAISNKHGHILLNTSNKSELAVGYGTLYGDMCGGLSVIGDCYKTEVYRLSAMINQDRTIIPANIISKAPSAELRPGQFDSDSLPAYDVLDAILYRYIECRKSPDAIINEGFDSSVVNKILRMVDSNEWKRHQLAPVLRVSGKAFGRGRRMPLVARYGG